MRKVNSSEVAVVIQGPVTERIVELLGAVIQLLPDAEIILSTWSDHYETVKSLVSSFNIQVVITPSIKASYVDPVSGVEDNLERQILSTMNGLLKVSRPYVAKIRSDSMLTGDELFCISPNSKNPLLKSKITITNYGFVDPAKLPYLAYFSDMAMFGETADIITYWKIDENLVYKFGLLDLLRSNLYFGNTGFRVCRYGCEQQLGINFSRKLYSDLKVAHINDFSKDLLYKTEKVASDSFHMIDYTKSGVNFGKRFNLSRYVSTFYSPKEFASLEMYVISERAYKARYKQILLRKFFCTLLSPLYYKGIIAVVLATLFKVFKVKRKANIKVNK